MSNRIDAYISWIDWDRSLTLTQPITNEAKEKSTKIMITPEQYEDLMRVTSWSMQDIQKLIALIIIDSNKIY